MEKISPSDSPSLQAAAKAANQKFINTSDKQLSSLADKQIDYGSLAAEVSRLPVNITDEWIPCVVGHIQHFGLSRVLRWANVAATKRAPENYFMSVLRRERYGK